MKGVRSIHQLSWQTQSLDQQAIFSFEYLTPRRFKSLTRLPTGVVGGGDNTAVIGVAPTDSPEDSV